MHDVHWFNIGSNILTSIILDAMRHICLFCGRGRDSWRLSLPFVMGWRLFWGKKPVATHYTSLTDICGINCLDGGGSRVFVFFLSACVCKSVIAPIAIAPVALILWLQRFWRLSPCVLDGCAHAGCGHARCPHGSKPQIKHNISINSWKF